MKYKKCPKCGSENLGDCWQVGRKLRQYCHDEEDCGWVGAVRVPETQKVTGFKDLRVDDFSGHAYTIYDKYGHVMVLSQTYGTAEEAHKAMKRDILMGEKNPDAGPYTGVRFNIPAYVKLRGKMFKVHNGKVKRVPLNGSSQNEV
jgi:hypothetical protein